MAVRVIEKAEAQIRVYKDGDELALKAARYFARMADQYVVGCGRFTVALSGGSTPKSMFALLAKTPFFETVPWSSIYFFWGDERHVPPTDADSNYRMTREALLAKVPVPEANIFRIPSENDDAAKAAAVYGETLRTFFLDIPAASRGTAPLSMFPRFDLVFLGMGPDGHTASLFPETAALENDSDLVVANYVEKFDTYRITLTKPVINNARNVTFLVSGADKAPALKEVLEGAAQPRLYPSQLIRPARGTLLWMVDEAAASRLSNS